MLAEVLHIRPWEHELLTADELTACCDYIDEQNKRVEEATKKAR